MPFSLQSMVVCDRSGANLIYIVVFIWVESEVGLKERGSRLICNMI